MHTGPMQESDGKFSTPDAQRYACRKCRQPTAKREIWESHCGGYEDEKYTCEAAACGHTWWIDGIDS